MQIIRDRILVFSIITLLIGLGIGYYIRDPEISILRESKHNLEAIIDSKNETISAQQSTIDSQQTNMDSMSNELSELESEYNDLITEYDQLERNITALLDLYSQLTLIEPEGTLHYTQIQGIVNGDFSDHSDGLVGWVIQGKSWHNEDGVYLHQFPSTSFMIQNIPIESKKEGIKFNLKPVTIGASISIQVTLDNILLFEKTYNSDLASEWETIIIPFKYLLEMRDLYNLPEKDNYELRFTIPSGPDNGAHIFIDEISLVEITYQPPLPDNTITIEDDFSEDSGYWTYQGTAHRDTENEYLVLVTPVQSTWGHIWLKQSVDDPFSVSFRYKAGGGNGGGGLILLFYQKTEIDAYDWPEQTTNVAGAVISGRYNTNGYAIELDNYKNSRHIDDPSDRHIALRDSSKQHLAFSNDQRTRDNQWHEVLVNVTETQVKVYLDSELSFDWDGTINPINSAFGFGAACGAATGYYIIDDVSLTVFSN